MARRRKHEVVRTRQADRDLDALFDFLFASYLHFGDSDESAFLRATERVERVKSEMRALGDFPSQGTLMEEVMPGLRRVTKDRAIFYFTIDDEATMVRVLAVFFGGQDHERTLLKRLHSEPER